MSSDYQAELAAHKALPDDVPFTLKRRIFPKAITRPTQPQICTNPQPTTSRNDPDIGRVNLAATGFFNVTGNNTVAAETSTPQVTLTPVAEIMTDPASPFVSAKKDQLMSIVFQRFLMLKNYPRNFLASKRNLIYSYL